MTKEVFVELFFVGALFSFFFWHRIVQFYRWLKGLRRSYYLDDGIIRELEPEKSYQGTISTTIIEITERLFDQNIPEAENDYLIFRVVFKKDWKKIQQIETIIYCNRETGLSAMQIATSSVVAAIAQKLSRKKFPAGVYLPHEVADFEDILGELIKMKIAPIMTLEPFLENKEGEG